MTPELDHFVVEIVAFTGALADAGEHRHTAVRLRDVVDQLHDGHGLADAGAAEQADLAALGVGRQQIDDLDAGDQHFGVRRLIDEIRGRTVDRQRAGGVDGAALVDRLTDDVDDAAQRLRADRHGDRVAGVQDFRATHQTVGAVHGDGADRALAQMLRHFQDERLAVVLGVQRVQDRRQDAVELHVDDGARNLRDLADRSGGGHGVKLPRNSVSVGVPSPAQMGSTLTSGCGLYRASAPEMISINSLVM